MERLAQIKSELKTLNEAELHGVISGAILEIKSRSYHEGFDHAVSNGYVAEEQPELSPQQLRDEIVEEAKRDVADLIFEYMLSTDEFRFVINKEKRTIVALDLTFTPSRKGIAKCDPSDCFNVHIGKAIALRRALGLEIPSEYYNAPQPTEVRVGDVVNCYINGSLRFVHEVVNGEDAEDLQRDFDGKNGSWSLKFIDDSRVNNEVGSEVNGEEI